MKYGYKWWLYPRTEPHQFIRMAWGFGGQHLMVFPEEQLIVVATGWQISRDSTMPAELVKRILPAIQPHTCEGHWH